MTEKKRVLLNVIATYSRSLFTLVCGIFTARWILMALGEVDYGLFGVVGGLSAFVSFINSFLAEGVGRYYGISVGKMRVNYAEGLEDCHKWFTTSFIVHTTVPILLVLIGYPIGHYVISDFLTIPSNRVETCIWVWRFTCISCFVSMISVPFSAMYIAKQEIAELTIYNFVSSAANVVFLYIISSIEGEWLFVYSCWTAFIVSLPLIIICIRGYVKYEELKFDFKYIRCINQVKEMTKYSGWLSIGNIADLCKVQAMAVLVNKYFGPTVNAAMTMGTSVSNQATTFCSSMTGALWPVILNAWGEGNKEKAIRLSMLVSKIATVGVMLFAVPMILEIDIILNIWLKNVPEFTSGICVCFLIMQVIDKTSRGYGFLVNANGKMALYQLSMGVITILTLPISWLLFYLGFNVYAASITIAISGFSLAFIRVFCTKRLMGLSIKVWVKNVLIPLLLVFSISSILGFMPRYLIQPSLVRVIITTVMVETVIVTMSWHFLIGQEGQFMIKNKLKELKNKISIRL